MESTSQVFSFILEHCLTAAESAMPVLAVRAVGAEGGQVVGARGGAARLACEARYEPAPGAAALAPAALAALPPLRIRWTHDGQALDPQVFMKSLQK